MTRPPGRSAADHSGTAGHQRGQGRQAGPDAAVIRDTVAVERHVEIGAYQDAQALDREVIDRLSSSRDLLEPPAREAFSPELFRPAWSRLRPISQGPSPGMQRTFVRRLAG
jgi:hypothetical protein